MREMNFATTDDSTHFLWLGSAGPCSEQWARGALTGRIPSRLLGDPRQGLSFHETG